MPTASCSKCGADLREGSQMCLECGEPIGADRDAAAEFPPDKSAIAPLAERGPLRPRRPRRRGFLVWVALGILLLAILWATTSANPFAQGIQALAGSKQDQTIVNSAFTVSARSFRYYRFSTVDASHVAVVGQFTVSNTTPSRAENSQNSDDNIEVYVMSESAFAIWQNGYAAHYVYESGPASQGNVQTDIPGEAGIYYLVFSNKFSPKSAKKVNADMVLRYKSWIPQSLRRAGERFWNWFGL